ncbi:MAG TPA: hypothetical protein VK540_03000 [Polyangiaceae bacterium]|nr:hypothetical protein [Polyangiaceae bacterium]
MAACDAAHLAECTIDLFQGPVLAPARATALGGAFAAYAEGVDAIAANAAAVAVRVPYSLAWADYDLTLGVSFPAAFRNTDFDNDGKVGFTYQNFFFYSFGAQLQLGAWGVGLLGDFQTYDLLSVKRAGDPQVSETLGKLHAVVGRSFFGGQLALGAGLRGVTFSINSQQNGVASTDLGMQSAAPQMGVQIRPDYFPWRLGATFRAPVEGRVDASPSVSGAPNALPFIRPAGVSLPWELELGAAIQLGPRPLNPQWLNPREEEARERKEIAADRAARRVAQDLELDAICDAGQRAERARGFAVQETSIRREEDGRFDETHKRLRAERRARYANWPRERITVLIELLISGKSADAIGLESYFSGQAALAQTTPTVDFRRSGENVSYSPRLGFEGEPVANWLQTRFGTYIEPSRLGTNPRQHFTFGFDMKLAPWSGFGLFGDQIWRIGGVADLAPRYQSFSVSLGAWH